MSTDAPAQRFVDEVISEIIEPGVERLLESRYFADLRAGTLTKRRMQGFAIQHYRHNMAILKGFALLAVQAAPRNDLFRVYAGGLNEEITHPDMCKKFGFALGLSDDDFENALPTFGCLAHTAACLHDMYLATPAQMRANALSNETMVQRYSTEFDAHLRSYGVPDEAMEFFIVHMGADVEHTERAANAIAQLAVTDEEQGARARRLPQHGAVQARQVREHLRRVRLGDARSVTPAQAGIQRARQGTRGEEREWGCHVERVEVPLSLSC